MCGIVGVISGSTPEDVLHRANKMLALIEHRGPDDDGLTSRSVRGRALAVGARRLAIQDLSEAGHQPMEDVETGNVLVFNGEIYNAPLLRRELQRLGYTFTGGSDTEVILRSYREWGKEAVSRFRGMFALAFWDEREQQLILVRDPLGIKPLYYSQSRDDFAFASEVRALRASGLPSGELDPAGISDYLSFGSLQDPRTVYRDIVSLPAGHLLVVKGEGAVPEPEPYWKLRDIQPTTHEEAVRRGRDLVAGSVERHLLSDVPVGIFLSSGFDSSLVLRLAALESQHEVSAFTVTFPDLDDFNEGPLAARIAKEAGVAHTECVLDASTTTTWAMDALGAMDQPSADGLNTYIVSRAVRAEGLKVALSGLGGDEMFGGYRSFRGVPKAQKILRALGVIPARWRSAGARAVTIGRSEVQREKLSDMAGVGGDLHDLFLHSRRLFSDSWLSRFGISPPLPTEKEHQLVLSGDPVASIARLETSTYLRNTLLRDSDVFGMANSLEIRVPMLDQDLAEWALSLPGDILLPRGAPPKYLLRRMFPELLLSEQTDQPKKGFELPIAAWLNGPLAEVKERSLQQLAASAVVDPAAIKAFETIHRQNPSRATGSRMWALVVLGHWLGEGPGGTNGSGGRSSRPTS